jgi:hypothetical protein
MTSISKCEARERGSMLWIRAMAQQTQIVVVQSNLCKRNFGLSWTLSFAYLTAFIQITMIRDFALSGTFPLLTGLSCIDFDVHLKEIRLYLTLL